MGSKTLLCCVVGLLSSVVWATPTHYTFDAVSGQVTLTIPGYAAKTSAVDGTYAIAIEQQDGHFGTGDTFLPEESGLFNTQTMSWYFAGLTTATISPGSLRFLDFAPTGSGRIADDLVVDSDMYAEVTITHTLLMPPFTAKQWAGQIVPITYAFSTSAANSGTISSSFNEAFRYVMGVSDLGLTITIDIALSVQGTAHAVPDPSLGGLVALGLGGAGAWLRRRS